jgi:membrane-associated phospholipid phosphatase
VRLVAEDFWSAATSPLRAEREHWIRLGQVVAIGGVLFVFDEDLDRAAQRNRDEPLVDGIDGLGSELDAFGLMGKTWPLYAGTMVVGYVTGVDRMKRIGGEILVAQWMAGALRNGFKLAVGRRRPNEGRGARFFEWNGGTSLPSGHASSVFAVAEVLRLHARRWWVTVPLYTAAAAVGVQRVTSRQHWASDSWIGAVSGVAAARFVHRRHEPGAMQEDWTLLPVSLPDGSPGLGVHRGF